MKHNNNNKDNNSGNSSPNSSDGDNSRNNSPKRNYESEEQVTWKLIGIIVLSFLTIIIIIANCLLQSLLDHIHPLVLIDDGISLIFMLFFIITSMVKKEITNWIFIIICFILTLTGMLLKFILVNSLSWVCFFVLIFMAPIKFGLVLAVLGTSKY